MIGEERNVPLAACGDGERRAIGGFKETTNGFVEMTQLFRKMRRRRIVIG